MKLSFLVKKTRGATVRAAFALRYGTEKSLRGVPVLAEFAASMLTRGTTHRDRAAFEAAADAIHLRLAVEPQVSGILLTFAVPRRGLDRALELVAEAVQTPAFARSEVEMLRQELLTGFRDARSDSVQSGFVALARAMASLPREHPAMPPTVDERISAVAAITPASLLAFHSRFYGAQNSQFAIVGDFDPTEAHAELERLFGAWRAKETYAEIPRIRRSDAVAPILIQPIPSRTAFAAWEIPLSMNESDPDWPALWIASYMLGGGFRSGRIAERLREKDGLAYSATTVLKVPALGDAASLGGYAICAPQDANMVEYEMKDEVQRAVAHGFTEDELTRARTGLLRERSQARATDQRLVRQLVEQRFLGRTMRFEQEFDDRLKALTVADVARVLNDRLDPARMVMVMAGPFKKTTATAALPSAR